MKPFSWPLLLIVLAVSWLLWSGHYSLQPLIFTFGVLSCLLVVLLTRRMDRVASDWIANDPLPDLWFPLRLVRYAGFLTLKILRANIRVTRLILDPAMPMSPRLLRVEASQKTAWGQVIYANSITLTPGTITLDMRDRRLLVHALGPISESAVSSGEIDRAVSRLEGLE